MIDARKICLSEIVEELFQVGKVTSFGMGGNVPLVFEVPEEIEEVFPHRTL
jgi:hypothetical protein